MKLEARARIKASEKLTPQQIAVLQERARLLNQKILKALQALK